MLSHGERHVTVQLWLGVSVSAVQIQYSSLPNYEEREEDFNAEAVMLRRRFTEEGVRLACWPLWLISLPAQQ